MSLFNISYYNSNYINYIFNKIYNFINYIFNKMGDYNDKIVKSIY